MSLDNESAIAEDAVANANLMPLHSEEQFGNLDLACIVESRTNPRTTYNEAKMVELTESVSASGVHQPVLVRPLPAARLEETFADRRAGAPLPTHEIVAGHRRFRASQRAKLATIPAMIRRLTDAQVLEIQLVENLQRDDLSELEEAEGYQRLCAETTILKEEIAAKIGKSRSYVYARMKLLDLTTAPREALRTGAIDSSRALVIARIPDPALQQKALEKATEKDWQGSTCSYRQFVTWVQQNVMLRLDTARFQITDASLVPSAGSCTDCQKRTGANPDLFADVDSADVCIDPKCFHDKQKTHAELAIEAAEREGKKVLSVEKAAKIFEPYYSQPFKGYMVLDKTPEYSLGVSGSTLRKSLGKHCPPPILILHPKDGGLVEVVPTDAVKKVIKAHGLSSKAKAERRSELKQAAQPIEMRPAYAQRWNQTLVERTDAHLKAVPMTLTPELLRAFLVDYTELDIEPFAPALDMDESSSGNAIEARIQALGDDEVMGTFIRFLLHDAAVRYGAFNDAAIARQGPRTTLFELAHMAGVGVAEVKAETRREMEGEDRVAELAAEAKKAPKVKRAAAPKAAEPEVVSPKKVPPKKIVAPPAAQKPRARKTSAAEVMAQAAAAFQALDEAPGGAKLEEVAADAAALPATDAAEAVSTAQVVDQAPDGAKDEEAADAAAPASSNAPVDDAEAPVNGPWLSGQVVWVTNDPVALRYGVHKWLGLKGEVRGISKKRVIVVFTGSRHGKVNFDGDELVRHDPKGGEEHQATAGVDVDTPALAVAKPLTVGDRVRVDQEGNLHHGKEGTITRVLAGNINARVSFGPSSTAHLPLSALRLVIASVWPFPPATDSAAPKPVALTAGTRVRVKEKVKGLEKLGYIQLEGQVKNVLGYEQGNDPASQLVSVYFEQVSGRLKKTEQFRADELEVLA